MMVRRVLHGTLMMQLDLNSQYILLDCFQIRDSLLEVNIMVFRTVHTPFLCLGDAFASWKRRPIQPMASSTVLDPVTWQANHQLLFWGKCTRMSWRRPRNLIAISTFQCGLAPWLLRIRPYKLEKNNKMQMILTKKFVYHFTVRKSLSVNGLKSK